MTATATTMQTWAPRSFLPLLIALVALAAIHGLYKIVEEKNQELDMLKRELLYIKKQLALE